MFRVTTPVGPQVGGPDAQDPLSVCRPLGVEVYRLDDALLEGWSQPERAAYKGMHGLHISKADWEMELACQRTTQERCGESVDTRYR